MSLPVEKTSALGRAMELNAEVFFRILVWALAIALYIPIFVELYHGRLELVDYTHAYFILPTSVFIAWLKRHELGPLIEPHPSVGFTFFAAVLFILGLVFCIIGWKYDYLFVAVLSLIPFLAGLIGFMYGPKVLGCLIFPLAYLVFMAPPPSGILDSLTIPMRYAASMTAAGFMHFYHIPVHREGLLLFIKGQEVFIAPACSGFRSLITVICLSLLYLYFLDASLKKKLILFLTAIPLAIIGNICRILVMCLVTYYYGIKAEESIHGPLGYLAFFVVIGGFMLLDCLYKEKESPHVSSRIAS